MKTLILVRHAKSSRDDIALPDRERPLAERGERDAPMMGRRLAKRHVRPDQILTSPALRAQATARLLAAELDIKPKDIRVVERIYPGSPEELLDIVRGLDDKLKRVMLVGHNPAFAEFAQRLAATIADMPTCAVAEFDFDAASWSEIGSIEPARVALYTPKQGKD